MRIDGRLQRLEGRKQVNELSCAIVGISESDDDLIDRATAFWCAEGGKHGRPHIKSALPLPGYAGSENKFLGFATPADVFFLYSHALRGDVFHFFQPVASAILNSWEEIQAFFAADPETRDGSNLSNDALTVLEFIGSKMS